jgi:chromosome segregation ATPase
MPDTALAIQIATLLQPIAILVAGGFLWFFKRAVTKTSRMNAQGTRETLVSIDEIKRIAGDNAAKMDRVVVDQAALSAQVDRLKTQVETSLTEVRMVAERLTQAITEVKAEIGQVKSEMKTMWGHIDNNKKHKTKMTKLLAELETKQKFFEEMLANITKGGIIIHSDPRMLNGENKCQ